MCICAAYYQVAVRYFPSAARSVIVDYIGCPVSFAQTLRMMALSKTLIKDDDIATKREAYYVSKNWGDARFAEQPDSDTVMDDIEAMFGVNREQIGFIADEHGGDVAGKLVVHDKNDQGTSVKIDCTKMGSGAYSIPTSVEHLKFETNAKFILAIETKGMFERLNRHGYWKKANCIIISMGGVPSRACRRFIRKSSENKNIKMDWKYHSLFSTGFRYQSAHSKLD